MTKSQPPQTGAERVRKHRERLAAAGLIRREYLATETQHDALAAHLEKIKNVKKR